jgi:O-antigen/teichoic acid export membrane protein
LRYELAIPLPRSDGNAFSVLLLAFWVNVLVAVGSFLGVLFLSGTLARTLHTPELPTVRWILPLSILGAGSNRALRYWAIRHHDFNVLAKTQITQSSANAVFQIGSGLVSFGGVGLAIGHTLGLTAGAYRLARTVLPRIRSAGYWQPLRMRIVARRYARFPKFDVAAAFIDTLSVQLPNLFLPLLFSPAVAGAYLLADRILGAPVGLVSQSVGQVLYAKSREAIVQKRMAALAKNVSVGLLALSFVPALVLFLISEPLVTFIFGEAWREAGGFAGWLVLGLVGQLIFSSVSLTLMATNAQNVNLILHSIMLVAKGAALFYGYAADSPLAAIIALSAVNLFGYLGATGVIIRQAHLYDIGGTLGAVARRRA